jgi:lysophospholipase L1-like esterase
MRSFALLFLTCVASFGAVLEAEKLFREEIRIAIQQQDGLYLLEQSDDLKRFAPIAVLSNNSVELPSSRPFQAFRAEKLSAVSSSFSERAGISSAVANAAVNDWITRLTAAGYQNHSVFMASFLPDHVGAFATNIPAILGPELQCNKAVAFNSNGILFDGSFYLEFKNPLPETLAELSIFAVFSAEPGNFGLLAGSDGGEGRAGPALWVGGDPYITADPDNLAFSCTADGRAIAQPGFRAAATFNFGNRLAPQVTLASVSSNVISIQTDIDREYSVPLATNYPIANQADVWRIGQRLDGVMPFKGTVSFIALFDARLGSADLAFLRQAYRETLGKSVSFPPVQLIIEGDSLSEEAFGTEYGHWLHTASNWQGRFTKRNIASYGETTAQMLDEFGFQVPTPQGQRNYLFLWGGRNDLPKSGSSEIFGRLQTYWKRARQAGYKVAAFTVIPAGYESSQADIAERRRELNTLIRSAGADYDFLFDVDGIPALQDPTDTTYFKSDGVHITAAGSQEIANLINNALTP